MGRPSVAVARRQQIMEATLRSIAAHGLAGTTLDRIAEEAGMARGHVRHFAGNREEVLTAAAWFLYFGEVPDADVDPAPVSPAGSFLPRGAETMDAALDYLFGAFSEPTYENAAALAFVEAARTNPQIHALVLRAYRSSQDELAALLAAAAPEASSAERDRVAYGILAIALGNVFMSDIEVSPERTAVARDTAEALVSALVAVGHGSH